MQEREGNGYHGSCSLTQSQSQMMYVACAYVVEMGTRCHATQNVAPHLTKTMEMRMWKMVTVMWMSRAGMRMDVEQCVEECRKV
jgi:hypothetical protein